MTSRHILGLLAALALLAAFIFGVTPIRSAGVDCGNAFKSSVGIFDDGASCDDLRTGRQPLVWTLFASSAMLGLAVLFVVEAEKRAKS